METETKVEERVSAYYKKHLKSLKLMGVFAMVSVLSTSLGLGINTIQHGCTKYEDNHGVNKTGCNVTASFDLPDNYVIRVCQTEATITLDLRKYINHRLTAEGATLTFRQWDYLYRIGDIIHNKILEHLVHLRS